MGWWNDEAARCRSDTNHPRAMRWSREASPQQLRAGREPDEIKYFAGLMTTVTPTVREGLDRRLAVSGDVIEARLPHLGALLGLGLDPRSYDEPLTDK
ncbi:hypothetical protein [Arthrobacter sp.]|uniref:hypothetical protein n=1 Tax=Arthrobacter sp. TaxID=1667 RepID=UPI0028119082|nr:hypothetical protein [Arthrobacter sp.]